MFHQLNQRAVGQGVAPDDLRGVRVFIVEVQAHLDLDRILDDVVVGEDETVSADDEARSGRARNRLPVPASATTLLAVIVALPLTLALALAAAGSAEEAAEEVVAAAEQTFEILGL